MYIKSMVIDGFKSYAQRTEIRDFDPLFNAITGLNGSGKSNILDSICFLLGISNLSQVRAGNLQDLVYKCGQAGITKAIVSIVFDNSDKKQSPLGYEQYNEITVTRQVVIGGRNKYLINGSNANNTRVQDLFRSVQLNVNNPHFLIMQGRITKVLNMKPPEILSMIEEAAGTRLYETKKESAQRTIEKKDAKLKEIDVILEEDITPTLAKLKKERSSYLEYQKLIREMEHLNKLHVAYQFVCAEERKKKSADEVLEIQETIKQLNQHIKETEDRVAEFSAVIADLEKKRDEEGGNVLKTLQVDLSEKQTADAKVQSALDSKKESLDTEQKKKKDLEKQCNDNKATIEKREIDLSKILKHTEQLKDESTKDQEANVAAQKHFQAVTVGLSSNADGQEATLNEQLMAAKSMISSADTGAKQAQMKLKDVQQKIKLKQLELKKTEQSYKKDKDAFDSIEENVKKLEAEMNKLGYDEDEEKHLTEKKKNLSEEIQRLQEKLENLEAKFPRLRFDYTDPEKNFDRSRVRGLVCKLIKLKKPVAAMALEMCAGDKLFSVVVNDEVTGKKLLQKGELKQRCTIIPLNKISARSINPDTVKRAESLVGKENVQTALSLVGYKEDLQSAMNFVFGTSFVCKDMNCAKKVTFHETVQQRSVTLDGDLFDPAGTLTGGAQSKKGSILLKLQEIQEVEDDLHLKQKQLAKTDQELQSLKKISDRYSQLKNQYDLKVHELRLLKTQLKQSTHHQQLSEYNTLQKTIEEHEGILKNSEDARKKAMQKVKDIEDKMKNASAYREKELKDAEENANKTKKKMEASIKKMKEKQQEVDSIKLEMEELRKETLNYEGQMKSIEEAIRGYEQDVEKQLSKSRETKKSVEAAQTELNNQKELLKECNEKIKEKAVLKKAQMTNSKNTQLKIQELEHKKKKLQKESKDTLQQVEHLLEKYDWIADEKKYFGQPDTVYDFKANNPKEAEKQIRRLQNNKEKLSKNVNMRAMNMLEKAEEQYNDLIKKRKIVLNDKVKIAAVIAELDEKKKTALKKAWEAVNKDFGSIFSTLLPGTQAKLSPPEGQTVLDGLEVKVAFGDIWKESLNELSGGQRSLVALSLILAMLLFKPAPIYILDEVDAALDLSHTQNIGKMIKTHFKHSQFIVVSLKDGMFSNANVLFKTRFVDGVSMVSRHVQQQSRTVSHSSLKSHKETDAKSQKSENKRARVDDSNICS